MYPEDCIQYMANEWWIEDDSFGYCRGRLIWAFLPHVDQVPYEIEPIGRSEPTEHGRAEFHLKPLRVGQVRKRSRLPVAAMPHYENEVRTAYRAKRRPGIIVCEGGEEVDRSLVCGKPKWQTAPTVLVVPCYGIDERCGRSGFPPLFVDRVRRCMYSQFVWEKLPIDGAKESIVRLDHIQPIGRHHDSIEMTHYRLGQEALEIFDEWLAWLLQGELDEESVLFCFKSEIADL